MQSKIFSLGLYMAFTVLAVAMLMTTTRAAAQTEDVLYSFTGSGKFGSGPVGGLTFDAAGNLYGTTVFGGTGVCGSEGCGTAFELMPMAGGGWTQKVLHSFHDNGKDGWYPVTSLTFDAAGNLYGTTENGGSHAAGTVFELTPTAGGDWTQKILHNFGGGTDGAAPEAALIFDGAGNLYGTTASGGAHLSGTVFELSPAASGWTEKLLHSFAGYPKDGADPVGSLIFDAAGNLYGTTAEGGKHSTCPYDATCGTVFELMLTGGSWMEKVLYNFKDTPDGNAPGSSLIFDAAGNLYGTTEIGGNITSCNGLVGYGCGTVFELTPSADGEWTETVLHDFGSGTDGFYPGNSGLIFDAAGNLYGTATSGGTFIHFGGVVFEMTPTAGGGWTESLLYSFGEGTDGANPKGDLIFDTLGNLYGTTYVGGAGGDGMVFEITP